MADSPEPNTPQGPKAENDELSKQEQEQISGGWGDIQGSSTDDKHKSWSEVTSFTNTSVKTAP